MLAWDRKHCFLHQSRLDNTLLFQHLYKFTSLFFKANHCAPQNKALNSAPNYLALNDSKTFLTLAIEIVEAWGHENVRANHRTTLEITRDEHLTPRGDCIIAVRASKGVADLDPAFKDLVRKENSILIVVLEAGGFRDIVIARGSEKLELSDTRRIIVRKSRYIESATLGIEANKAARDLSRELIASLRSPNTKLVAKLIAIDLNPLLSGDNPQ